MMGSEIKRRNRRLVIGLVSIVFAMIGVSYAAVPLYTLFCQVTGFGGTTQRAEAPADRVVDRTIKVRFNADVNQDLPWAFAPETREVSLKLGEAGFVSYRAENTGTTPVTGTAVYNVTPAKAGIYFSKVQCFCFDEQTLQPGQGVDMPVQFFVDPAMADDRNLEDVETITLSYTFFRSHSPALDGAVEELYQSIERQNQDAVSSADGADRALTTVN